MINPNAFPIFPESPTNGPDGKYSMIFDRFHRTIFERTGGPSGIATQVANNITAAAAGATSPVLSMDINEVLQGSGQTVTLAALQPGQVQKVFNGTGGNISVYPNSALWQINALGLGNPFTVGPGVAGVGLTVTFTAYSGTQIRTG